MITYQLVLNALGTEPVSVNKFVDGVQVASIPFDPDNQDFVQYQKWLSEGNQPLPADEPNA